MGRESGIERHELNYGWGHQPGWTENTEITLIGDVRGDGAVRAVRAWFDGLHPCERPHEAGLRYHGGATMELAVAAPGRARLAIRSTGEDAFDSVAWYAQEVTDLVEKAAGADRPGAGGHDDDAVRLRWTEVPVGGDPRI